MNELDFAARVRQHLNQGLQRIDNDQLDRLRQARERAVSVQKQAATSPILAAAGHFFHVHTETLRPRHLVFVLGLLLVTLFAAYWQADTLVADLSEVDTALLADEVPVEALLDAGFESWLGSSQ